MGESEEYGSQIGLDWIVGSRKFSIKILYLQLRSSGGFSMQIPVENQNSFEVKIFSWLMLMNSILDEDNLTKRGCTGNETFQFCGQNEMVYHLFFQCPMARFIWQVIVCSLGLSCPPKNVNDLAGAWIDSFYKSQRKLMMCGEQPFVRRSRKLEMRRFENKFPDDLANVTF
jgi:hypothetical protein